MKSGVMSASPATCARPLPHSRECRRRLVASCSRKLRAICKTVGNTPKRKSSVSTSLRIQEQIPEVEHPDPGRSAQFLACISLHSEQGNYAQAEPRDLTGTPYPGANVEMRGPGLASMLHKISCSSTVSKGEISRQRHFLSRRSPSWNRRQSRTHKMANPLNGPGIRSILNRRSIAAESLYQRSLPPGTGPWS